MNCSIDGLFSCYKQVCRKNRNDLLVIQFLPCGRINPLNRFNFIAPKENPITPIRVSNKNINGIAFHPESTMSQILLGSAIENIHQFEKQLISWNPISFLKSNDAFTKFLRVSDTINTRNRRNYYHISSSGQ